MADNQAPITALGTQPIAEQQEIGNPGDTRKFNLPTPLFAETKNPSYRPAKRKRKRIRGVDHLEIHIPQRKRQQYFSAPLKLSIAGERNDISELLTQPQLKEPQQLPQRDAEKSFVLRAIRHKNVSDLLRSSYITYWVKSGKWPEAGFEPEAIQLGNMGILVRRKSSHSLRRKRSHSSITDSTTPSDQKPRELKTSPYAHRNYATWLKAKGVYTERSELGILEESKKLYKSLLGTSCDISEDSIFRDDIIEEAIEEIQDMSESRIVQDISRLLVPSVGAFAKVSDRSLGVLIESVNEGWDNCFPLTDPRSQPGFAVGFRRSAFGDVRIKKLQPLVGDEPSFYQSRLMATHYMYFPIFTSEVKCGATGLDIADRQNAHSMGIAVGSILFTFRLAKRHMELHRKLLTFSVSNDHQLVRLYGWYPVINGDNYIVHRHLIHAFNIVAKDGEEKWTTRRFSIGVYKYALTLLGKINAIIDELPPDLNLGSLQPGQKILQYSGRSQQSELSQQLQEKTQASEHSGLSQQLDHQSLTEEILDGQLSNSQQVIPNTSITERTNSGRKKRTKNSQ